MLYLALRTEKKSRNWFHPLLPQLAMLWDNSLCVLQLHHSIPPKDKDSWDFCVHVEMCAYEWWGVSFGINLHVRFTWVCFVIVWEFLMLLSGDGFLFVCLLLARGYMVGWGCLGREFQESAHFLFPRTGIKGMTATSCFSFLHFFNSILF